MSDAAGYEKWIGRSIDVTSGWEGLPWDADPRTCSSSEFRRLVPGSYVIDRVELVGGQSWAYLVAGSQCFKVDAFDALGPSGSYPDPAGLPSENEGATGYESWVGRAIDVPYGWMGIPWEVDPRTCDGSEFRPLVPGTYAVNRVESIGGQPWAYLVAGSLRYKVDAQDALGLP